MKPLGKVSAKKYQAQVVKIEQPKGAATGAICKTCSNNHGKP